VSRAASSGLTALGLGQTMFGLRITKHSTSCSPSRLVEVGEPFFAPLHYIRLTSAPSANANVSATRPSLRLVHCSILNSQHPQMSKYLDRVSLKGW
jgi:hypothetical protein